MGYNSRRNEQKNYKKYLQEQKAKRKEKREEQEENGLNVYVAKLSSNAFAISFDYNSKVVDLVKTFEKRRYVEETKEWIVSNTTVDELKAKFATLDFVDLVKKAVVDIDDVVADGREQDVCMAYDDADF